MLPNLIIIGAMKCGTTSLHSYLSLHPEIKMSRQKELDFFVDRYNWHRRIDWYQSQFKGKAKIYGKSSPNYSKYPRTLLRRVYEFLEVDPNFQTWYFGIKRHSSTRKRRKTELGNWLTNTPPIKLLNQPPQYVCRPIEESIYYFFSRPVDQLQISEALRQELKDCLREDVKLLQEFTGCDFKQ